MPKISYRSSGQFQSCARRLAFAAGFALSAVATLAASNHTWDGGGANDFWNNGLNWSLNVIPASGDNLRFAGAPPLVNSNNFAAGTRTFNSITFAAAGYDIRGTEVWTDAGGISVTHGAGLTRVRAGVNLTVAQTIHVPNQFAIVSFDSFLHAASFPSCTISNAGAVEIADLFAEGNLTKRGSGLLTLKGSVSLDTLAITEGTVWANGSGGAFSLQPGATLRGKGTILGIAAWSGGTVHPGDNGLGLLTSMYAVALGHALTTFRVVLNDDSAPGVGYDALWTSQLYLSNPFLDPGSEPSNASLDVVLGRGFLPLVGQAFRIINVNNPSPIVGTFAGLPEGAVFTVSNVQFSITYTGFSGNDVTLQIVDVLPTGNTRVWDGGGANNYWTNAANWVGDVAPTSGDSLVFPLGAARLLNTNNFPANIVFNAISLTGGGYLLRGNQIELLAGLHASQPSGGNTVALPLRLGADQSFTNSAPGGLTLSGAISLNGNDLTFQSSGGTLTVSGAINGLGSIEKRGSGNVTFSGANGYFGLTRVSEGRLTITDDNALGQSFTGTIVTNTGTLYLAGEVNVIEPLILVSAGGGAAGALVNQENANEWAGDITLSVNTRMGVYGAAGELTLSGAINGPGGLLKTGSRRLNLTGPTANSYAGATTVLEGELRLGKTSGHVAIPGNLTIGDGVGGPDADIVMLVSNEQIADGAPVTITASGLLAMTGFLSEQIGSLSGSGNFTCCNLSMPVFCVGDCVILVVGENNASTTFSGTIAHGGDTVVEKRGTGTWTLSGDAVGRIRVTEGTIALAGADVLYGAEVRASGTLSGTGLVQNITVQDDGALSPGTSPGTFFVSGLLSLKANGVYQVELNGPNPGADYDQVRASQTQLTGGAFDLHANFAASPGQQFVIISNTSAVAVQGTFAGLPEGTVFSAGGQNFQITYQGGNGNDVVLTTIQPMQVNAFAMMGGGVGEISGQFLPDQPLVLEAAAELSSPVRWEVVNETRTDERGNFRLSDPAAGRFAWRFYRVRTP